MDTNVLVELLRDDGPVSGVLAMRLRSAAEIGDSFHIPFTCLGELWRTLTEVRGYGYSPDHVQLIIRRTVQIMPVLMPPARFNEQWLKLAGQLQPTGAAVFDVQIAALCVHHKISELWTFDSRFPRIEGLLAGNPLGA